MADEAAPFTVEDFQAGDGYRWRYRRYLPAAGAAPKARVVLIHGIQSHGGWYEHSCTRLAHEGYAVSFLDRRGSGLNQEARGDCPSFRRLLDDIAEYIQSLAADAVANGQQRCPVFLGAISWGGKLAVALERRHPGIVDGIFLVCPGFISRIRVSVWARLKILFSRLFGPRKLFPIPLSDPELFTATPQWLEFLRNDPLRLHRGTARLLVESARLDAYLSFVPKYVHVPVLLLLAGQDRIVNNAKTKAWVKRFATPDQQIFEYPEAHHTLEFEPDPEKFIGDVVGWLNHQTRQKVKNDS